MTDEKEGKEGKWGHLVRVVPTGETADLGVPEFELQLHIPESWDIDDGWYPLMKGIGLTIHLNACSICELLDKVEEQTREGS